MITCPPCNHHSKTLEAQHVCHMLEPKIEGHNSYTHPAGSFFPCKSAGVPNQQFPKELHTRNCLIQPIQIYIGLLQKCNPNIQRRCQKIRQNSERDVSTLTTAEGLNFDSIVTKSRQKCFMMAYGNPITNTMGWAPPQAL